MRKERVCENVKRRERERERGEVAVAVKKWVGLGGKRKESSGHDRIVHGLVLLLWCWLLSCLHHKYWFVILQF
jgi:hypothetical protein